MVDTYIQIPKPLVTEGNSFNATARFRSSGTATAPTTAYYRIDDLNTGTVIQEWSALVAAEEISIPVTSNNNRVISRCNPTEKRRLTVSADKGETTETRDNIEFLIENRGWRDT